ncbi:SOS response-associated peptidase [Cytobacillus sp. Hz8]|uniref:SOS response-associated peptidase n=1 Tax=Cytobacillus sp. Hz8 TaxID=3347168 RepID=UPI0035DFFF25
MCGRFTLTASLKEIAIRFETIFTFQEEDYAQSFNIAPSQSILAVINDGIRNRLGYLRWGLIPPWAKDMSIGYKLINARAETVTEKPSFKNAFMKKRCLIIADSFYEWKRKEKDKIPMRIRLKSGELFAMAGIWEQWNTEEGKSIFSCSIITTEANDFMKPLHDRMPVILKKDDEKIWLNKSLTDPKELIKLLRPYDGSLMEAYEVSPLVNTPKNNSVQLIQRID